MTNQENKPVQYYAALLGDDDTAESPSGLFRYARGVVSDALSPEGTWEQTNWFLDEERGEEVGEVVPITPEQAAVLIHRWRETGALPKVEGLDIPPLPVSDGPPPRPGSGPVSPAQAQAMGDHWVNGDAPPERRVRAGIYEFDLGYIVYDLAPAPTGLSRPPANVGAGRGVIDRETGKVSMWPSLPLSAVAEMYREAVARRRGRSPDGPPEPDDPGALEA